MPADTSPAVGDWYKMPNGQSFEVVAFDEDDETIEIQYFDGTIEEIDMETWQDLPLETIARPDNEQGPFDDPERDDYGDYGGFGDIDSSPREEWVMAIDDLD